MFNVVKTVKSLSAKDCNNFASLSSSQLNIFNPLSQPKSKKTSYLAKKDKECVKYVLIHELCHLIEFNHSKDFKSLMDKFCPDWRQIKKRL